MCDPNLHMKSRMTSTTKRAANGADLPTLSFATPRAFSDWLAGHHASSRGIWLRLAKKGSGAASITYGEAIDVALAWGWIDGQKQRGDEASWLQKFTPRGARSVWSKINRGKALALMDAGAAGGGRARQAGWALGCCLRSAEPRGGTGRPGRGAREQRTGGRLLRDAGREESLRGAVAGGGGGT